MLADSQRCTIHAVVLHIFKTDKKLPGTCSFLQIYAVERGL